MADEEKKKLKGFDVKRAANGWILRKQYVNGSYEGTELVYNTWHEVLGEIDHITEEVDATINKE